MLQTYWKYDKKNDLNHLEFPGITVWEGSRGKSGRGQGKSGWGQEKVMEGKGGGLKRRFKGRK